MAVPGQLLVPDAELLVIEWARANVDVKALIIDKGGKIGSAITQTRPLLQVNRVGGSPDGYGEDRPQLQISAWADTDGDASLIARTVVAALPTILSTQVRGWGVLLGPLSQPDNDNHRYITTVELLTYAGV